MHDNIVSIKKKMKLNVLIWTSYIYGIVDLVILDQNTFQSSTKMRFYNHLTKSYDECKSYLLGKMTKLPFTEYSERATELLDTIHSDICGALIV